MSTYYQRRSAKVDPKLRLLRAHTAVLGGHPHDRWGDPFNVPRNQGAGHAKCSCGAMSEELDNGRQRRAWQSNHRQSVLEAELGSAEKKELQDA